MRIAIIATYTHPTRRPVKELSIMQSSVPELIAVLCPDPSEVAEHFTRLCTTLGSLPNLVRHYWSKLMMSNMPRYKSMVLFSGPEILSIRNPVKNKARRYIAGLDPVEDWDAQQMAKLGLPPQRLS